MDPARPGYNRHVEQEDGPKPRTAAPMELAEQTRTSFDRDQAERVLGRAAAMQMARSEDRVTLGELQQAAAEAGIEQELVVVAARELQPQFATPGRRLGMQTRVVRRRFLPRKIGKRALELVLARLDAFFGAHGERTVLEDSASWSARHVHVTFEPQDQGTLVQVSERFVNTTGSLAAMGGVMGGMAGFLPAVIVAKVLGLGKLSLLAAMPMAFLTAMLGLWVVRRYHARTVARAEANFARALDSIEELAGQAALPPASGDAVDSSDSINSRHSLDSDDSIDSIDSDDS